jgi:hypothetical protein
MVFEMRVLSGKARVAFPRVIAVRRTEQSFEQPKRSAGAFSSWKVAREANGFGSVVETVTSQASPPMMRCSEAVFLLLRYHEVLLRQHDLVSSLCIDRIPLFSVKMYCEFSCVH